MLLLFVLFLIFHLSGGDSSKWILLLLEQLPDQLMILFESNPNVLELNPPNRCLFRRSFQIGSKQKSALGESP